MTSTPRPPLRTIGLAGLDHLQLAMPAGEETLARLFYGGVLGLQEVRKPASLRKSGGIWFVGPGFDLHLGVEDRFRPARKAHLALVVRDLDHARRVLATNRVTIDEDASDLGVARCYVSDPFGNRIELVAADDAGFTRRRRPRASI